MSLRLGACVERGETSDSINIRVQTELSRFGMCLAWPAWQQQVWEVLHVAVHAQLYHSTRARWCSSGSSSLDSKPPDSSATPFSCHSETRVLNGAAKNAIAV